MNAEDQVKDALNAANEIALCGMRSGQEVATRDAAEKAKPLLDALEEIAQTHEKYDNATSSERSALLYEARCVAREAIAAYRGAT